MGYRAQLAESLPVQGEERLLTTNQVAARLHMHAGTVANWRMSGKFKDELPFIRIGLRVRYRESDVLAFMARGVSR